MLPVDTAFIAQMADSLDRRIRDLEVLRDEVAACVSAPYDDAVMINWQFDVEAAREERIRHYPVPIGNTSESD